MNKTLLIFLSFAALSFCPARAHALDPPSNSFSNFGGTDYFPANNNSAAQSNSALAATGNNFNGSVGLETGSASLNTGGAATSVPQAAFTGTGGPSLNSGGAPSSVPLSGTPMSGGGVPSSVP